MRVGTVHGPISRNDTGRPRYAAASMRTRTSGRPGSAPSHAARTSAKSFGVHSGAAGVNDVRARPAARKSGAQSGAGAGVVSAGSRCGGTRRNSTSRPRVSTITSVWPLIVSAGSVGETSGEGLSGSRPRGLVRYQKTSAGPAATRARLQRFVD